MVSKEFLLEKIKDARYLKDLALELGIHPSTLIRLMKIYNISSPFKQNIGKNSFKNKHHTKESKEKMSSSQKLRKHPLRLERVEKSCPICGSIFVTVPKAKNKSLNRKYCSPSCASKGQGISLKNYYEEKHIDFISCHYCNREFYLPPSLLKKYNFCCYECYYSWVRGKNYEERYGEEKADLIKTKIVIAGLLTNKKIIVLTKPHIILREEMIRQFLYEGFKTSQNLGCFEIDELNNEKKIAIEIDGDYWHCNPKFYSNPNERQIKKIIADKRKNTYLKNKGYILLRFWEDDIYNNLDECITKIKETLKK